MASKWEPPAASDIDESILAELPADVRDEVRKQQRLAAAVRPRNKRAKIASAGNAALGRAFFGRGKAPAAVVEQWACGACTLMNAGNDATCGACGGARPAGGGSKPMETMSDGVDEGGSGSGCGSGSGSGSGGMVDLSSPAG